MVPLFLDPGVTIRAAAYVRVSTGAQAEKGLSLGEQKRRCEERIAQQIAGGATLVLVSHDAALVERTCSRVIVLDRGELVFDGPTEEGIAFYRREALVA